MKENLLMQLNYRNSSSEYNNKNISEMTYIDQKTGCFKSVVAIDDVKLHLKKNDSTSKPIIFNDSLFFLSDKTGFNQLYRFEFKDESIKKITNFKYGVSDYLLEDHRLIIKTRALHPTEKIIGQLNKKEIEEFNFSLKHDAKIITSLDCYKEDGYTPFIDVFYSYNQRLTKLQSYLWSKGKEELPCYQGNMINESYKKSILVFNNQFRKEVLEYFHSYGFNIYCLLDDANINTIKGKKYAFYFEDGLITKLPLAKHISKAISFSTRADKCISVGLTNGPIIVNDCSLVDSWVSITKSSTMKNVDQINCDVLLVHPQFDYTHPLEEAELLYSALKDRKSKLDVQMLVIPEENQHFFEYGNMKKQIRLYEHIIQWMKRGNK